jgi:hypothetical protein
MRVQWMQAKTRIQTSFNGSAWGRTSRSASSINGRAHSPSCCGSPFVRRVREPSCSKPALTQTREFDDDDLDRFEEMWNKEVEEESASSEIEYEEDAELADLLRRKEMIERQLQAMVRGIFAFRF